MEYRDFFKNKKTTAKDIQNLIPEGVDPKEFQKGVSAEIEHTEDQLTAATIASKNLQTDANYYSKIQEHCGHCGEDEEEEEGVEEHCGACEDDMGNEEEMGSEYDENGGLPLLGGALNVPHHGQPIRLGKIIQVGKMSGKTATGELSGMTKAGVTKDRGGVPANQEGDKEPLTAGGKKLENSIASKSVGGPVSPGEGQKQGGLNTKGTIANTAKLDESKVKVRKIVKEVLKEIKFDKSSGKWMKINESKHKAGCTCGFCKNKGTFGKKNKKEDMDEATVDMKMGPSYKVVHPTLLKTSEPDQFSRTNEYEPEISEMYDDEEECMMNERYVTLANAQRNLTESELFELKSLREKIDMIAEKKKKKFLQKAIKKSHKGYCTPMSKPTCTPHRKALAKRLKPGGDLYKGKKEESVDENTVDMKMGPSYKVVQPRLYKTAEDDFARTNEYDPEVSEGDEQDETFEKGMQSHFSPDWAEEDETSMDEVGGQAVQHSSYRTVPHGNLPQRGKQRWADDLDEGSKKPSKVAKSIQKGMKPKTTLKNPKLKFQKPKKTSSGVHKRKP
jgi:hypothetical protein